MSSAFSSGVKLEIGHVLFIDIVGYSKLLINEQSEQMQKLREIVRGTEQFGTAEAEGTRRRSTWPFERGPPKALRFWLSFVLLNPVRLPHSPNASPAAASKREGIHDGECGNQCSEGPEGAAVVEAIPTRKVKCKIGKAGFYSLSERPVFPLDELLAPKLRERHSSLLVSKACFRKPLS